MSRTGQWVFEMQQDAAEMTLSQFIEKHGAYAAEVWHDVHFGDDRDMEPDLDGYEAMRDGYHG